MKPKKMLEIFSLFHSKHIMQKTLLACACTAAFLTGCAVGPDYVRPEVDVPTAYKEDGLWKLAKPADEVPKGEWWKVFKDPVLNQLMEQLNRQNLTIIQAEAQYRQAAAYLQQAESGLFPTLDIGASRIRGIQSTNNRAITNQNEVSGTISWEIDIWGEIRRSIEAGEAGAAASLANVAATRLSAQAQLAKAYLELRVTDCQIARLKESEKLLEESLKLTRNQFNAGIISDADVAQAESLWKNAPAATLDAELARTQLEQAIAISIGQTP
ncbi:MAG: TolC family protein, partial [Oxalobacter sp.]